MLWELRTRAESLPGGFGWDGGKRLPHYQSKEAAS